MSPAEGPLLKTDSNIPSRARKKQRGLLSGVGIILRLFAPDGDVAARESQLAQLVLERLPVHAEHRGGARDVAARLFEAARDVAPLELAPVFAEVRGERDGECAGVGRGRGGRLLLRARVGGDLFGQ